MVRDLAEGQFHCIMVGLSGFCLSPTMHLSGLVPQAQAGLELGTDCEELVLGLKL